MLVILGDNIIGGNIIEAARRFEAQPSGAKVLLTEVENPQAYGVAELDGDRIVQFIEKPEHPPSNLAVTGIYFYDENAFDLVRQLDRSARGELEVTDLNNAYLARGEMTHDLLEGYWADCGESIEHYLQACNLVAEQGANRIDPSPSVRSPLPRWERDRVRVPPSSTPYTMDCPAPNPPQPNLLPPGEKGPDVLPAAPMGDG